MKNIIKKIIISFIIVAIAALSILIFNKCSNRKNDSNNKVYNEESLKNRPKRTNGDTPMIVIGQLIKDNNNFDIFEDFLSENFKKKYKTKYDIMKECDDIKGFYGSSGKITHPYYHTDLYSLGIYWKEGIDKPYATTYYYDFIMTSDGQIDDFKLVDKVDYGYDANTDTEYRLDGKKEISGEAIKNYLCVFTCKNYRWNPYFTDIVYENSIAYQFKDTPLASNCIITGKPDDPYDMREVMDFEDKLCYAKLRYGEELYKYYIISFDINDYAQFTKIEYKELSKNEFDKMHYDKYGKYPNIEF